MSNVAVASSSSDNKTGYLVAAALAGSITLASCENEEAVQHPNNKKIIGSFLLTTSKEQSEAAMIAAKAAVEAGKSLNTIKGKNEEVGKALIAQREKQMGPNISVFYKQDGGLVITSGKGVHMKDIDGNLHLDCCNNVASVGHAHPRVVEAGSKELGNIQTNGRFLNPIQQRYVAKLLSTMPPELDTIYFVNSGSEANDLALRIARAHTTAKRPNDVAILDSAYHGHTQALVDISPYKWYQAVDGKNYKPSSTHVMALPDAFRGKHRVGQNERAGALYAAEVEELVSGPEGGVGTFIAESIVGCGGQVVPPPGYLKRVYEAIRKEGGVCIADEVQTGFARAGTHFWMFQEHGVVPDIVTMGKPMGNGYPIAAVVCRREVAESFAASGIEYFNTYGGNSVACAIAEAVLDTINEENLQENARVVGEYLTERLTPLIAKYDWVGDVRGSGLFQGIEFVRTKKAEDLQPHPDLTKFLVDYLRYQRIIVSRDGPDGNVIKVKPPLVFSKENVDTLVTGLDQALECAVKLGIF
eukprot:CAMPEP_0170378946 /NCGR_PEP_ID=MMETSP0117_2-20130122/13078_1 /TAXON_ID=400756 /ORGANISM="Durinskia baltica, Strain CSIRO CS-38" /LENGTH=527 /DNA_ID=CAMNT_0010634347 /DNA_START=118 /DNA_END=1701 /DNA_ORIENTATION=+